MMDKESFLKALKKKDLSALDYFVDNYSDFVLKVSYSVLNNLELSEECTNDVMLKVWDNIKSYKGDIDTFPKWLVVITKRHAIDIVRKEKRHSKNICLNDEIVLKTETLEEEIDKKLSVQNIEKEVNKLDEKSKNVFIMRYFKGKKVKEISEELGISNTAVSNRLLRGRKKLMETLERR